MRRERRLVTSLWGLSALAFVGVFVPCVVSVAGSTHQDFAEPNDLRWDLAEKFAFVWNSAELSSTVTNSIGSDNEGSLGAAHTLTIFVSLDVLDSNDLVAMEVSNPVLFAMADGSGSVIGIQAGETDGIREYQEVKSVYVREAHRSYFQVQPAGFQLELAFDPNHPAPSSLSRVEGYVYALYAQEIEVDVPFDPNGWVDCEGDLGLMICVDGMTPPRPEPIQREPVSAPAPSGVMFRSVTAPALYEYATWVKSRAGTPVKALRDFRPSSVGVPVDYIVMETQLFDSQHARGIGFPTQWVQSDAGLGASCYGWVRQHGDDYDTIRHILAIHPVEAKIPFVLTNIPIPTLLTSDAK